MRAKFILFVFAITLGFLGANAQNKTKATLAKTEVTPLSILPLPTKAIAVTGSIIITNKTQIVVPNGDSETRRVAQGFADRFKLDGTNVSVIDINSSKSTANVIFFLKNDSEDLGTEGYRLSVTPTQININAATPQGFFYAVQSLLQLLPSEVFSPTPFKSKLTDRKSVV